MPRGVEIYVIYIRPSISRKSRLKMQNEDLRQNAYSSHIILANWRDNKAITTYLEYLTIGAHMRTIFFCSKSSKGFLKLTSPSSSLSSSPSAMMNDTQHAIGITRETLRTRQTSRSGYKCARREEEKTCALASTTWSQLKLLRKRKWYFRTPKPKWLWLTFRLVTIERS